MCVSTNSWRHVSPQPSTPATLPSSNCRPGRTSVICNKVRYRSFPAAHGQLRLSFSWRYLFKVLAELVFFLLNLRKKISHEKKDTLSSWCLVERGRLKGDQRKMSLSKTFVFTTRSRLYNNFRNVIVYISNIGHCQIKCLPYGCSWVFNVNVKLDHDQCWKAVFENHLNTGKCIFKARPCLIISSNFVLSFDVSKHNSDAS